MKTASFASSRSLLIADDHAIVRIGLQLMLQTEFRIFETSEAVSCSEVLSILRKQKPSHLITDMSFRDGSFMEIAPTVHKLFPQLNILVYSMMPAHVYEPALKRHGVRQFVSKDTNYQQTLALFGSFLLEPPTVSKEEENESQNPFSLLTSRETDVLHYLLKQEGITTIAQKLNLHKSTVSTLKIRIMEKAEVHNINELLLKASAFNIHF